MNPELDFIRGVRALNVPRIEDLPYWTSPPVQFVYQSTADLHLGSYTWANAPSALLTNRPVLQNAVYFFRHLTFTADISELDYTANLVTIPAFQTYLKSTANTMLFREPVLMTSFLRSWDFRFLWDSRQARTADNATADQLLASFNGSIVQGPNLVGKNSITLTAVVSAQEIVDEEYLDLLKKKYPGGKS